MKGQNRFHAYIDEANNHPVEQVSGIAYPEEFNELFESKIYALSKNVEFKFEMMCEYNKVDKTERKFIDWTFCKRFKECSGMSFKGC